MIDKISTIKLFKTVCRQIESKLIDYPFSWKSTLATATADEKANALYDELSIRSGILILNGQHTAFGFQNDLMESYLAAYFFAEVLSFCKEKKNYPQEKLLAKLITLFSDWVITPQVMNMLVMSISVLPEHQQKVVLKYILARGFYCTDRVEKEYFKTGIENLRNRTLGHNLILLDETNEEWRYTDQWLAAYSNYLNA